MKAAVCYEFGKPLVIEEVEIEPPGKGEVKVRLAATAICHSDIHLVRGEWGNVFFGDPPLVAGHEAAGVIEEIGQDVTQVKQGDAVVVSLLRSCGECFCCSTDAANLCEAKYSLDTASSLRNKAGQSLRRGVRTAAFAEYVVVHQSQVVQIPQDMPMDRAALLSCGVLTGLGAVVNSAQVKPGSSVVVIGAGGIGLNAVQGALLSEAHPIIAVDILDSKLASARAFGATDVINARQNDPLEAVKELTSGRGSDYVFVTVGNTKAADQGLNMLRNRGTLVMVGLPETGATLSLPVSRLLFGEHRVIGSFMGSSLLSRDVPRLVDLYRQKRLKLDELITARYPLEKINEAIDTAERGEALRNVIVF